MVIIDKSQTRDLSFPRNWTSRRQNFLHIDASLFRHVPEGAILLIVEEKNTIAETNDKVGETVVVIVTCCTGNPLSVVTEASFFCHIFKLSIAEVVIERHRALSSVFCQKNIDVSIIVVIQKTRTWASEPHSMFGLANRRS